jgi:hypothetical protein
LRRIIISGATLVALVGAAAALAAGDFNSYNAMETFCTSTPSFSSKTCAPVPAGSKAHPVPGAIHELWAAHGLNGHNTAPLTRIVARMYGIKTDAKDFPVCTAKMINNAGNTGGWTKVCPKGAEIASGPVNALFVPYNQPTTPNPPQCNPWLTIWNGGVQQGRQVQVFFFEEFPYAPGPQYTCLGGGVKTGAAAAYNGYVTNSSSANHNTWSINIPLPPDVSTMAGGIHGVYASLVKLNVVYKKLTKKTHGHTVAYGASIGCKAGKRPYSFTFYAQNYQGQSPHTQTTTVPHTAVCK